jgi:DNA-binding MarR family transcriptional regulator
MCNYYFVRFFMSEKHRETQRTKAQRTKAQRRKEPVEARKPKAEHYDLAVSIPQAQHAAWYQLLRAHGKVTQCLESRLLRAHQSPHHWYDVLVTLEKAPEQRLRLSELAENVVTSRSNLTRLVDRLEAEGLLRREPCPDDRRGFYAVLTEAGTRARLAAWPIVSQAIAELFAAHVSDEEAHITTEALRVADVAGGHCVE